MEEQSRTEILRLKAQLSRAEDALAATAGDKYHSMVEEGHGVERYFIEKIERMEKVKAV